MTLFPPSTKFLSMTFVAHAHSVYPLSTLIVTLFHPNTSKAIQTPIMHKKMLFCPLVQVIRPT